MARAPYVVAALLLAGCAVPGQEEPAPYYADVLRADPFAELVVEIDHAPGREPSVAAREHLLEQLRAVTQKTRIGIRVEATLEDEGDKRWSSDELVALEAATRTAEHAAPVAVLHVLYPTGTHTNGDAVGITISSGGVPTVVVFLDKIAEFDVGAGPLPYPAEARTQIEKATLLHEAGHGVGLVDNGLPMVRDHEDPESPGHSSNPESVMSAAVDQLQALREALLHDGSVPQLFDADDRADLRAGGGR